MCVPSRPSFLPPFVVQSIDGQDINFDRYKNKVLLIINVASACGEWGGRAGCRVQGSKVGGADPRG